MSIPSAIPSVVRSHAFLHPAIAFFITTTKSGPGLITAKNITHHIIRSVDIIVCIIGIKTNCYVSYAFLPNASYEYGM